ncbi:hypothetical protein GCM10028805_64540 [Spirosoma harenae]
MNSQTRKQQLLQMYAERTLQGDDLVEFRHLAQTDLEFRREAELERRIRQAVRQGQHERLRDKFNQYHTEMLDKETIDTNEGVFQLFGRPVPMKWAAAASVVAVLTLSLLVWQLNRMPGTDLADQGKPATITQQTITPTFGLAGADSVETSSTTVLLSPGPANQPQYRFRNDTLQLYGDAFRAEALTLIVHPSADSATMYQIRVNDTVYKLNKNATSKTDLMGK